jgi:SpoVK/Ycf46/Vps4 family AAA+-type ATPase
MSYYVLPDILDKWVTENKVFFRRPKHQSLMPRGLLFDGPPGVGKTMGAKYVAREFGVPLYRLDIGAMKGKYVGDSESNLLAAIAQVDTVEPCVVIFDEVEKIFTNQSDQGVTTSMLSQVLWWLQEHKTKVFSVMTTNNRKIIPSELYREGRIDEVMVFEGVEGLAECLEFSLGAFQTLMDDMKEGYDLAKATKSLKDRIKTAYLDVNYVVPQAKLMQLVYGYVKSMLNEVKS